MNIKVKIAKIFSIISLIGHAFASLFLVGIVGLIFEIQMQKRIKNGQKPTTLFNVLYIIFTSNLITGILTFICKPEEFQAVEVKEAAAE